MIASYGCSAVWFKGVWERSPPGIEISMRNEGLLTDFIQGSEEDLQKDPASFVAVNGKVLVCGRGPYFPAWPDVLQLNAFSQGLRGAVVETVQQIELPQHPILELGVGR